MRPMAKWLLGTLVLALPAGGCQPLNYEKSLSLEPGSVRPIEISAPSRDQSIKVTVHSDGAPVSVYVVLQKDHEAVQSALLSYKKPDASKILASQENTEDATFDAKIPAKNDYAILVHNGATKGAQVKVTVKGS
jgi:hypothetical protein